MSKAERTPRAARSLLMLVQALEGMSLIVELSNDTVVRGRVESVDDAMNITVADAVCDTVEGVRTQLPSLFIRGRLVRFIHLPEALDPERAIEEHRRKLVDGELHYARKRAGGASAAGRGDAMAQPARGSEQDAGADGARTAD